MIHHIENELYTARYTELVVDSEEVVAHGVLAYAELKRDLTVCMTIRQEVNNLSLSLGKGIWPAGADHSERRSLLQGAEHKSQLNAIGPNLSPVDDLNTFAEPAERFRPTEDPRSPRPKGVDYQIVG